MDARVLKNPFSRSLFVHLLLLLILVALSILLPKTKPQDEQIAINLIDHKKKNEPIDSDKDRVVKVSKSARQTGISANRGVKAISVKDLGVKISTNQSAPPERRKNWAAEALGEEYAGGEYVEGLKQDETSALNTKEYIFFSYTERMRNQLYGAWSPIIRKEVERFYNMGFTLSADTQFVTRTRVVINSKGRVIKVQLLQESGVVDLDEAALTALNKAGPYPNPPKGLMNAKGNAELQWNFILRN